MSGFEDELMAGFSEVENVGMPAEYLLSNDPHTGIIRQKLSDVTLTEPGFRPVNQITITTTVAQFTRPPDDGAREIVQVNEGPFKGKWTLMDVAISATHYELTCAEAE